MPSYSRRSLLRAFGAGAAGLASVGSVSGSEHVPAAVNKSLADVRRATSRYQRVENAERDGYETDGHCVSNPVGPGAMGVHYVNEDLIDGTVDPEKPEGLVYEVKHGGLNLVAVEYISTVPFTLFGQESHPPGAIPFYSLHAWVWKANPDGVFQNFNRNVRCPAE